MERNTAESGDDLLHSEFRQPRKPLSNLVGSAHEVPLAELVPAYSGLRVGSLQDARRSSLGKAFEPPLQIGFIVAGEQVYPHASPEGHRIPALLLADLAGLPGSLSVGAEVTDPRVVPAVGIADGGPEQKIALASHPQRRARLLLGSRSAKRTLQVIVVAVEVDDIAFEQPRHDLERLAQFSDAVARRLELDARGSVLGLVPPGPHADVDAAPTQQVERCDHLGNQSGVAEVVAQSKRADPDSLGDRRHRTHRHEALRRPLRLVGSAVLAPIEKEVVRDPDGVEAGPLGEPSHALQ